jgi:hypothetical protein
MLPSEAAELECGIQEMFTRGEGVNTNASR